MSYKALYRTYRPNTFDEVAGQNYIIKTLRNAVKHDKIAHAYLFSGPRGTGKTSIAKIFAKAINCSNDYDKPCMKCDNCLEITNGTHPDIIEIDAASNNGVDEVRNLIDKVKYAPIKAKYKIYIIDEIHMMSTGAFNALLKTIEEPPKHVIFILATTEPNKVISTILSRCQRFEFKKVSPAEMEKRLIEVLKQENINYEDGVLENIIQLSDGGMRDAMSMLDQCIAYSINNITIDDVQTIFGLLSYVDKINIIRMIIQKNVNDLIRSISKYNEDTIDINKLTLDLINYLKESIVYSYNENYKLYFITREDASYIHQSISIEHRLKMIDSLLKAYNEYKNVHDIYSYFEITILKLLNIIDLKEKQIENNNVSRETLKKELTQEKLFEFKEESNKIELKSKENNSQLDEEFILRLLASGKKEDRLKEESLICKNEDYLNDFKYGKFANLLKSSSIVASGENFILFANSNSIQVELLNEYNTKEELYEYIETIFGNPKKVFCITTNRQHQIIQKFKDRVKMKDLPKPILIEFEYKKNTKEEARNTEELVIELFGKENIEISEE